MSGWSPFYDLTYPQYMLANSYVRGINNTITSNQKALSKNLSSHTTEIVASQQTLTREFQSSYDQLNNTLNWGINRLSGDLKDISWAIEDFRADFLYSMGLLLVEMQAEKKILLNIAEKLDGIHDTLKHPTLTQAREFYSIGEDRLKRKLLQKALESFKKARALNDADFFVEYQLGNIYLYGADDDENLIDLDKAKHHLLEASKLAKAEMNVEVGFSKFAAEALLKSSFVNFFKLSTNLLDEHKSESDMLLLESRKLALDAYELNPKLLEALYHVCKYDALLGNTAALISNLKKLFEQEPNYSIKVSEDDCFDPVRTEVVKLLNELKNQKEILYQSHKNYIDDFERVMSIWYDTNLIDAYNDSDKNRLSEMMASIISSAKLGKYLDYVYSLKMLAKIMPAFQKFKDELLEKYEKFLSRIDRYLSEFLVTSNYQDKYQSDSLEILSVKLKNISSSIGNNVTFKFLKSNAFKVELNLKDPYPTTKALKELKELKNDGIEIQSKMKEIEKLLDEKQSIKAQISNTRRQNIPKYAFNGAKYGVLFGFLSGCAGSAPHSAGQHFLTYFNAASGALGGLIVGLVFGIFLGWISGNDNK